MFLALVILSSLSFIVCHSILLLSVFPFFFLYAFLLVSFYSLCFSPVLFLHLKIQFYQQLPCTFNLSLSPPPLHLLPPAITHSFCGNDPPDAGGSSRPGREAGRASGSQSSRTSSLPSPFLSLPSSFFSPTTFPFSPSHSAKHHINNNLSSHSEKTMSYWPKDLLGSHQLQPVLPYCRTDMYLATEPDINLHFLLVFSISKSL